MTEPARITESGKSRLIFHPFFNDTIAELQKLEIKLPSTASDLELDFNTYEYPQNGELVSKIEEIGAYQLNPYEGAKYCTSMPICAYDESINKFEGLEGTAYLTAHSLIVHGQSDFIPVNLLTFYFYTRSGVLSQESKHIKCSGDPEVDSKKDYIADRKALLAENVPEKSVVFIDGPLVGGQMTNDTIELNDFLLKKRIIPIFFVKNSGSNLVTDNIEALRGKYNSDMHWAYSYLREGERTNLFRYVDRENREFAKVFCYLKAFNISPHRIEMDVKTFNRYSDYTAALFDLAYYLLLAQGDLKNPQIRSIAIAEKYARATLKLINLSRMMKDLGITPTMNQERFGW